MTTADLKANQEIKPWKQARRFKVGDFVMVKGQLKLACNKARIIAVIGECPEGESPIGKGYCVRFANGATGSGWFDMDFA
jgi:hypothetical protein